MNLDPLIRAVQRKCNVDDDGKAGPLTWQAIYNVIFGQKWQEDISEPEIGDADLVDDRSESNIETLLPQVRPYARALVHAAKAQGITIKIISGTRTYAEQDALYKQPRDGKDNDGDGRVDEADEKVTRAPAGYSNHNFGLAFDVGVWENGVYKGESRAYKAVGSLGMALGLSWGGNWQSLVDEPHFELRPPWAKNMSESEMLSELRERKSQGRGFFV